MKLTVFNKILNNTNHRHCTHNCAPSLTSLYMLSRTRSTPKYVRIDQFMSLETTLF